MHQPAGACVISLKAEDASSTVHDVLSSMGVTVDRDTKKIRLDKEGFDNHADRVVNEPPVTGLKLTNASIITSMALVISGADPSATQELELDSKLDAKGFGDGSESKLRIEFESTSAHLRYGFAPMCSCEPGAPTGHQSVGAR